MCSSDLLRDGDIIHLDAIKGVLSANVSDAEFAERRKTWKPHPTFFGAGSIWKYAQTVGDARNGAVTHPGFSGEKHVYADL